MATLDDLRDDGGEWPPLDHADRIETQHDFQRLYRNRRDELLQRWSSDLLRYLDREEDLVPFPAAKIAARTLAAFLFGEDPAITHDDDGVVQAIEAMSAATVLPARLLEGAITQIVQGEVYLRPAWDEKLSPWAIITPIPGAQVIPVFQHGMLVEAAVITEYAPTKKGDATYWRLVEQHEGGQIRYALFKGTADRIGREVDLTERAETAALDPEVDTEIDEPLIVHVPFGRDADSPHGVSLFDGLEGLAIALHRLYSQEQHDAEIARRRIAVSQEFIPKDASGRPNFDRKTDLFILSEDAAGAVGEGGRPVHPIEFKDDNVQRDRIAGRFRDFLMACGIAPDTIDANEAGGAITGTARKLAQAMTIQTASAAGRYWQDAVSRALTLALMVSKTHLGRDVPALDVMPSVSLADGLIDDPAELARIVVDLDTAEAVSLLTKVRMLHPDWSQEEVEDEVALILDETAPPPPPSTAPFGPLAGDDTDEDEDETGGEPLLAEGEETE